MEGQSHHVPLPGRPRPSFPKSHIFSNSICFFPRLLGVSPSQDFLYTGAGARLESPTKSIMATAKAGARKESAPGSSSESLQETAGGKQVVFHSVIKDNTGQFQPLVDKENGEPILR